MKRSWPLLLALAWCVVVTGAYYVANTAYYEEKLGVFGRYLLGFLS